MNDGIEPSPFIEPDSSTRESLVEQVQTVSQETPVAIKIDRPKKIRRPLAPATFLYRNANKTIPLTLVIILAVMLIGGIIALIDSIPLSIRTIYAYTKVSCGISPRGDPTETKKLVSVIKRDSPVPISRVIYCRVSSSQVESIVGKWPFIMIGLSQADMHYFLRKQGVTKITGYLPRPGLPEALVSQSVATNLHLKIGSEVQGPNRDNSYSPFKVRVCGIAKTKQWLMLNSIQYQEKYHFPPVDLAMIFSDNAADQQKLGEWATKKFKGTQAQVFTYQDVEKQTQSMFQTLFKLLDFVIGMLVLIITLMMGLLINIYQSQRLVEFGLLQAIGYTKRKLVVRSLIENLLVVILGWILGLIASYFLLVGLNQVLMAPHAYALNVTDHKAFLYTLPVPITVLFTACAAVLLRFRKFDPVAVVERRIV